MKRSKLLYVIKIPILFVVYLATARFGLSLQAVSHYATLVWLPSGLSLFALFTFGYRYWPGIFMGAFLANLLTGASPLVAIGIGIGNTLEAVLGTFLLQRSGFRRSLERLKDVLLLVVLATPLSTAVSASIGVVSLFLGHAVSLRAIYPTWQAWWIGDMMSFLIFVPFLFIWRSLPHTPIQLKRVAEIILLALAVVVIGEVSFRGIFGIPIKNSPITYLVFPPLIWAALRFGQRGAVTMVFTLSVVAVVSTFQGYSPYATGSLSNRLLLLQGFMAVMAVTTMILAAIDTERRRLEERKDEFISLASHELKSPLTSTKAFLQILQKKFSNRVDPQTLHYLEKMDKQINKQTLLINSLLDLSKIQTGNLEFQKEYFSLTSLISDTIETLQAASPSHTIMLKNVFKKDTIIIYADKERITQVLTNLLTNAIKYSPKARKVVVSIMKKKDKVLVGIKDFGIGMTQEQQEKLFQRYYRAHDSNGKIFPGLGLGLYISHEIIKQNNGDMWLTSKKGKGSTFYFSLPLNTVSKKKSSIVILYK